MKHERVGRQRENRQIEDNRPHSDSDLHKCLEAVASTYGAQEQQRPPVSLEDLERLEASIQSRTPIVVPRTRLTLWVGRHGDGSSQRFCDRFQEVWREVPDEQAAAIGVFWAGMAGRLPGRVSPILQIRPDWPNRSLKRGGLWQVDPETRAAMECEPEPNFEMTVETAWLEWECLDQGLCVFFSPRLVDQAPEVVLRQRWPVGWLAPSSMPSAMRKQPAASRRSANRSVAVARGRWMKRKSSTQGLRMLHPWPVRKRRFSPPSAEKH